MTAPKPPESLSADVLGLIVESILAFDGKFPLHLHWDEALTEVLRDPAVFDTYIATFGMIHGPSLELAKTRRPDPIPKGV
jgi:hypothetical protein